MKLYNDFLKVKCEELMNERRAYRLLATDDSTPEQLREKVAEELIGFDEHELYDLKERIKVAHHEAAHALVNILTGEAILDVWVSEFSSQINRLLGISNGFVGNYEATVYEFSPENETVEPSSDKSAYFYLLEAANSVSGIVSEEIFHSEKKNMRIALEESDDGEQLHEALDSFLMTKLPSYLELDDQNQSIFFKISLEELVMAIKEFLSRLQVQIILDCMAQQFLRETRMRGSDVKLRIIKELGLHNIPLDDLRDLSEEFLEMITRLEANLEKKLANLLESP